MKKLNKKGFTIVELVIVIAVIAILAAVMIPTFSGIIEKANQSAALQEATNTYKILLTEDKVTAVDTNTEDEVPAKEFTIKGTLDLADGDAVDAYITSGKYTFKVVNGKLTKNNTNLTAAPENYVALATPGYTNVYLYNAN